MKNRQNTFLLTLTFGLLIFISTACLPDNDPVERAHISLRAEFIDSGSMEPITNTRIDIFAGHNGFSTPLHQGWENTDDDGIIEGFLEHDAETGINRIIFITVIDSEEFEVEETVDNQFRYEEPFQVIDVSFEIAVTDPPEE